MIRFFRLLSLFLAVLIFFFALARWGGWWRVSHVIVLGAVHLSTDTLTKLSQSVENANILRLDLKGVRKLVEKERWVKEARVKLDFFARTVVIHITERKPVARIGFAGDAAVWVDEDGVVLSQADTAVLCGVAPTGNIVPREVVAAARAVERLDPGLLKLFPCFPMNHWKKQIRDWVTQWWLRTVMGQVVALCSA